MRYLIVVIFILFNCFVFAQSANKYPMLVQELNEAFKDDLLRGIEFRSSFTKDSLGNYTLWGEKADFNENKLLLVLISTKEKLSVGDYYVNIYWDLYSERTYASVGNTTSDRGILDHYHFLNPAPYSMKYFSCAMKFDIEKGMGLLDSVDLKWFTNGWYKGLEMYLDKDGLVSFDTRNTLSSMLDSAKSINWTPAVAYGQKRNTILLLKFDKSEIGNGKDTFFSLGNILAYYLDHKFQDELVRFEEDPGEIPYGKTVVSFVLNPLTDKFENPFLHRGDIGLGKELISWIEQYDFSDLRFYWKNYPSANRVYFYIK